MPDCRLHLDRDETIAPLDRRVFGSFVEHVGRCVHTGIHEPGHATADAQGFREDVLALVRELGATMVRYPGGNFVSGYDWEDGVGPRAQRPRRLDLAWGATETNAVGTDEFMDWCRHAGVQAMLAVNLGTRGAGDARRLLEYCNHPAGTALADMRRANGHAAPHAVRHWCLGNEMDAPWQIGQKSADAYGELARETARLMRLVEPGLQLTACGSSNRALDTFGTWEDRVLEHCHDDVDFISVHAYFENPHADTLEFLSNIERMDAHIREVAAIADAVATRKHSRHRVMLAVDEWNIWYKARSEAHCREAGWPVAPRLIEEVYTVEDALAAAGALSVLMNNADRVRIACLAQLVNAIGAIMTEPGGPAWRQTIFHPFALAARHARGEVLRCRLESPVLRTPVTGTELAALVTSATYDAPASTWSVFVLNRDLANSQRLQVTLGGSTGARLRAAYLLRHDDLQACNTLHAPGTFRPVPHPACSVDREVLTATLPAASWSVFVLQG